MRVGSGWSVGHAYMVRVVAGSATLYMQIEGGGASAGQEGGRAITLAGK